MAGLAIVAFTIAWLPYCVYVFITAFGGSHLIDTRTELIAALVAKSSTLYSPFIYALVNPRFRASVTKFLKIKQKSSTNPENTSNPSQPQVIFKNRPPIRPREGLGDNQSQSDFALPSYFAKKNVTRREPRVLFVRPDDSYFTMYSGESGVPTECV
ncbi:Melanopsin [Exaiptasia diaphana]|nr:Melanopsin [Exaiptasia diaphana]